MRPPESESTSGPEHPTTSPLAAETPVAQALANVADVLRDVAATQRQLAQAQSHQLQALAKIRRTEARLTMVTAFVTLATILLAAATAYLGWATLQQTDATNASVASMQESRTNMATITAQIEKIADLTETENTRRPVGLHVRKEGSSVEYEIAPDGTLLGDPGTFTLPRVYVAVRNPGRTPVEATVRLTVDDRACSSETTTIEPEATEQITVRLDDDLCRIFLPADATGTRISIQT